MANDVEENAPLLNIIGDDLVSGDSISSRDIQLSPRSLYLHCHVSNEKFDYAARNRLVIVLLLCIAFMIIEIVGGVLSNSTAVVTDAAHMCIDAASFLISLAAIYLARRKPTKKLSFGYIRAEVLGALLSVLTIWVVTGVLVYMAIQRCIDQNFEVKPVEMIVVASCGVFFNIVMFFVLHANTCGCAALPHHGHSHGHHHGHSHNESHNHSHCDVESVSVNGPLEQNLNNSRKSKSPKNINVHAAIIHVIGDFVQSIGVLCAAILIKIKPSYKLADPICTFIFSVLVLLTTVTIMKDIIRVLMEGVPPHINYNEVVNSLLGISGVRHVHSLHIWSLSLEKAALSVHIAIEHDENSMKILSDAQELIRVRYSITRTTIQIERYDEQIINSCESCRQLTV